MLPFTNAISVRSGAECIYIKFCTILFDCSMVSDNIKGAAIFSYFKIGFSLLGKLYVWSY